MSVIYGFLRSSSRMAATQSYDKAAGSRANNFGFVSQNRIRLPPRGIGENARKPLSIRIAESARTRGHFAKRSQFRPIPRPAALPCTSSGLPHPFLAGALQLMAPVQAPRPPTAKSDSRKIRAAPLGCSATSRSKQCGIRNTARDRGRSKSCYPASPKKINIA